MQAAFAPLRLLEPEYTQCIDYSAELGEDFELPHAWEYRFACDYMDVVQAHTIDSDTNSALAVLPGLHDLFGQSMVVTDGPTILAQRLHLLLAGAPKGQSQQGPREACQDAICEEEADDWS